MTTLDKFKTRVEQFIREHGVPATKVGLQALNDPTFVFEVRRGRKPNTDVMDRVDAWMTEYARENSEAA